MYLKTKEFYKNHIENFFIKKTIRNNGYDTPIQKLEKYKSVALTPQYYTEVKDTFTLDYFDTKTKTGDTNITLSTAADPGKVAIGRSTCTVVTNEDRGYYLIIVDENAVVNSMITHNDPHIATAYEIQGLTQFPITQNWSTPTTKCLGFFIARFPNTNLTTNLLGGTWTQKSMCPKGNDPDAKNYTGIPDITQTITVITQYENLSTTTNTCCKVVVLSSRTLENYQGSIINTATSDTSSRLN